MTYTNTLQWAQTNFGNTPLFNKKKVNRLVSIAGRLAEAKGTSLARLYDNWYATKAVYTLLKLYCHLEHWTRICDIEHCKTKEIQYGRRRTGKTMDSISEN